MPWKRRQQQLIQGRIERETRVGGGIQEQTLPRLPPGSNGQRRKPGEVNFKEGSCQDTCNATNTPSEISRSHHVPHEAS